VSAKPLAIAGRVSCKFVPGELVDQHRQVGLDAGAFKAAVRLADEAVDERTGMDSGELAREIANDLVEAGMGVGHAPTMATTT